MVVVSSWCITFFLGFKTTYITKLHLIAVSAFHRTNGSIATILGCLLLVLVTVVKGVLVIDLYLVFVLTALGIGASILLEGTATRLKSRRGAVIGFGGGLIVRKFGLDSLPVLGSLDNRSVGGISKVEPAAMEIVPTSSTSGCEISTTDSQPSGFVEPL